MAFQVWNYSGEPFLIWNNDDLPEEYTLIPPRNGMIYPVYFDEDTETWIESEEITPSLPDEPVKEQPEKPSFDPSYAMLAQANLTITKQAKIIKDQEKFIDNQNQMLADTPLEITRNKKSGGNGE